MKHAKLFASVVVFAAAAWPSFGSSISTNGLTLVDLTTDDPDHCTGTTSGYFSGSGIQYAFNNDETLEQRWALQNYRQGYVIYRFDTPTVVNGYGIWNHAGANTEPTKRAPRTWTFEASNDGESWTVLDTQPSETGWSAGQFRCYLAVNKTPYTYYKMNISNSIEKHLQVAHFEYFKLSFAELYDQFPGEVTVNAGETTLEIDYTNKILGSETVSEAWIDYGESEDALTEHAQPAETTATGIKFLISELPKHTAYSLRISFKLTGYEETFVVPVFAAHTRKAITLVPGSTTFLSDSSWDVGVMPADKYTDVVIDGDDTVDSSVNFSTSASLSVTNGSLRVDAGDSVHTYITGSSQGVVLEWNVSVVTNRGSIQVDSGTKNNQNIYFSAKDGPFLNAAGAVFSVLNPSWPTGNRTATFLLDGSRNDGFMQAGSNGKQYSYAQIFLSGTGTFVNDGTIYLYSEGTYNSNKPGETALGFTSADGGVLLTGSGLIRMDLDSRAPDGTQPVNFYGTAPASVFQTCLVNDSNHSIVGNGTIDKFHILNRGLIGSIGTNGYLSIACEYYGASARSVMTNDVGGRIVAGAGKGIRFVAKRVANGKSEEKSGWNARFLNLGLLEARAGSEIYFSPGVNSSSTSTGTSDLSLSTNPLELWGTIAGGGQFRSARPICIGDGAILSPGDLSNTNGTGTTTCGTLTFASNVVMRAGCTNAFQFARRDRFDALHVGGTLKVDGTLKVVGKPHGGTYRMITSDFPIESDNETFFSDFDMSAADGARAPRLSSGSETVDVEVETGEVDEITGEPVVATVQKTLYYVEASFSDRFVITIR